jgi:hypothetical protein
MEIDAFRKKKEKKKASKQTNFSITYIFKHQHSKGRQVVKVDEKRERQGIIWLYMFYLSSAS